MTKKTSFLLWDEQFPVDKDGLIEPRFSVQEAAKSFFGRKADWMRWRYKSDFDKDYPDREVKHPDGFFVLNGVPLEPKKTEAGARYYTLPDIERMAHALAQNGAIDGLTLKKIVGVAVAVANLYKQVAISKEKPYSDEVVVTISVDQITEPDKTDEAEAS